jgi:hypothetical protein
MNNVEAKFILQGYRPNGDDAEDATFAAALEQTRVDPALHGWFTREQAFDSAISAKLSQISPPTGLREAILAGARVSTHSVMVRPWWQRPAWIALAASVALIGAASMALWPKSASAGDSLAGFALADSRHAATHGGHGHETGALQAALNDPTTRLGQNLPVDFAALEKAGCRSLAYDGHEVLEVCFQRNGVWFHCYVARRADFHALAAAVVPAVTDVPGAAIATWGDNRHLFVVVSEAGRAALEKLL